MPRFTLEDYNITKILEEQKANSFINYNKRIRFENEQRRIAEAKREEEESKGKQHIVQKGESPWSIARKNNISLDELYSLNPNIKGAIIYPGQSVNVTPGYYTKKIDLKKEQEYEESLDGDNIKVIQAAHHDANYAIIDKKNNTFSIYDKNNNLLYSTNDIATGASGNDYNTITYVDKQGALLNNQGNNSTPAGMTTITGKGEYHGYPSFTRGRRNLDGTIEDVASSLHYGHTDKKKASNGCVRISGKSLQDIGNYLGVGSNIYTLPEQKGSRFSLRGGKLNFIADNPYGETKGDKKYWDDYNVVIDKSYSPLVIKPKGNGNKEHDKNQLDYANTISTNKEVLQKELNLSSNEYNRLAQLAMGLAEQESAFGTGTSWDPRHNYKLKQRFPGLVSFIKGGDAASVGYTQIKYDNDIKNKQLKKLYEQHGITKKSLKTAQGAAIGTMLRLAFVYNNEIKGRSFKDANKNKMSAYDALLYKYNGRHRTLSTGNATPKQNSYIVNVNKYAMSNDYFEKRKYKK